MGGHDLVKGFTAAGAPYPILVRGVTERARRAVGAWPDPQHLTDRLLIALEQAADAEPEGERRNAFKRTLDVLRGTGREVFVQTVANVLSGQFGHP